jgi:cation transport regulator ChaB
VKFCVSGAGPTQKGTGPTWFSGTRLALRSFFRQTGEFEGASHALPDRCRAAPRREGQSASPRARHYREAFNSAWQEYQDASKRRGNESLEEVAHKVAWAAVKQKYEKVGDQWRAKD